MGSAHTEELLRQILASPDDLELRAVYGDALQAAGDPRGEFIALELANDPAHAGRRITLLAKHARLWWPELPRHRIATRAGFVERVAGFARELVGAKRLFGSEPIRDVTVIDRQDTFAIEKLVAPSLRRLAQYRGSTDTLARIAASPLGDRLRSIVMTRCELFGTARLGDHLPACRELSLARGQSTARDLLPWLFEWAHLPRLEVLDLSATALRMTLLDELLARDLRALRVLRLSGNLLGGGTAGRLRTALHRLPALERVELVDAEVPRDELDDLRRTWPAHVALVVEPGELGTVVLDAIATQLVLVPTGPDRWAVEVDGVRRTVRWRRTRTDDQGEHVVEDWRYGEEAPLDAIVTAAASGSQGMLDDTRERMTIDLSRSITRAYDNSVILEDTAYIDYAAANAPISISFDDRVYDG